MSEMTPSQRTSTTGGRYRPYPEYKDSSVEWLGQIPAHWRVQGLKYVAPLMDQRASVSVSELPYVGLEHIEAGTGRLAHIPDSAPPESEECDDATSLFRPGDVLFGKLRPYLAKVLRPDFAGRCSTELLVLRSAGEITPTMLAYQLRSRDFIAWVNSMTYGTKMPRASPDKVMSIPVALAPAGEQDGIARFLDRETARIDALVAKKERLIELLQEKRTSLITQAVTRGLDENAPMRDSGVEGLGAIPKGWQILPHTKYVAEMSDYRGKTPLKTPDGVLLVTARNVRMGFIDYEASQEFVSEADYDEIMRRGKPRIGDILFTTEAPLGNVALVDREDIALAQRIIRFRMNPAHFWSRFTMYGMMSGFFQAQLQSLSTGSTAEGLKASKLPMLRLVAPPIEGQRVIAKFLDGLTTATNRGISTIHAAIGRLNEYRTALIAAAVTGKIDVRGEVGA